MSGSLYLRRARIEVGGVAIPFEPDSGLRFTFHVSRNPFAKEPNHAQVAISNLNAASRRRISTALDPNFVGPQFPGLTRLRVFAGYRGLRGRPGTMGKIFDGVVSNLVHSRVGADWETQILASEGATTNDVHAKKQFPAGTRFADLMKAMLLELKKGVAEIDVSQALAKLGEGKVLAALDLVLPKAFLFNGPIMQKISDELDVNGFEISQQGEQIVILGVDELLPGTAFRLAPDTGLVGTVHPAKDDKLPKAKLIKCTSLLRHEMQIGSAVLLDSAVEQGLYKIRKLVHRGDTHGREWYTEIQAVEASGGKAT